MLSSINVGKNKAIGGFFELELPSKIYSYHNNAIALSTGRACLRMIIQNLNIAKCYLPLYSCNAVFDPFNIEGVNYESYSINSQMEPIYLPDLKKDEYFLYINYFGVKSDVVDFLLEKYGEKLLIDNTHLFFHKGYPNNWSLTSARKYFGVPDGAYLYSPIELTNLPERFTGVSLAPNISRLLGYQQQGYEEYTSYEKTLDSSINGISTISEKLLSGIDYEKVGKIRRENFQWLHERLGDINLLKLKALGNEVPFAYPFMPNKLIDKKELYKQRIFIPSLWSDPLLEQDKISRHEKRFAEALLPIPIDHRYNTDDMDRVIKSICELL